MTHDALFNALMNMKLPEVGEWKWPKENPHLKKSHPDDKYDVYRYVLKPEVSVYDLIEKHAEVKEEKMADIKTIVSECEKMAKRYDLNMEVDWDRLDDILHLTFKQGAGIFWVNEENLEIHNVNQKNPAKILEIVERRLIKKFNIDLNKFEPVKVPAIKNVIFNDPATIIFWEDNTKTVVKAQDEWYDPEKGMAMAIAKKALGNQGNYCNVFKKWLPEEVEMEFEPIDPEKVKESISKFKKALASLSSEKDETVERV